MRNTKRKALFLAAATIGLLQTQRGSAATFTWSGGDGTNTLLSFGSNWVGGIAPSASDFLLFDGNLNTLPFNNYAANTAFAGIAFNPGAATFAISGNAITLSTPNLLNGSITNNSPSNQVLNVPISFAAGQNYVTTASGAGALTLGGAISRQTGSAVTYNLSGGGFKTSSANDATGIIGGYATIVTPSGSFGAYATNDGAGNVTSYSYAAANIFTGGGTITGTTATSNVLYNGGGNLTIGTGTTSTTAINTMLMNEQGTTARTATINGTLAFNAGGGLFHADDAVGTLTVTGGTITTTAPGELFVRTRISPDPNPTVGAPEGTIINSPIVDPVGGKLTLVKTGYGVLRLQISSTFSGGLYVNEGQLRPTAAGVMGTGSVVCTDGAFTLLGAAATWSNPFFISGIGCTENGGLATQFSDGAIRFNSAGGVLTGKITLMGNSEIGARGGQAASTAVGGLVSGQITGNFGIAFNQFGNQGGATIQASMPSITLTNTSNNWTGTTTVGQGRLRIGSSEVIPDGPGFGNLTLNGDTNSTNGYTILSLDGQTETINGLNSSGLNNQVFITNSGFGTLNATVGTLIVGNNNASGNFGGQIVDDSGTVSLTKIGTGTQTLSGQNTSRGPLNVNGGVLALGSGGTLNNALITVGPSGKFDSTPAGGFNVGNNGTLQTIAGNGHVVGVTTLTTNGVVAPGSLTSAGTLTFDNDLALNGGKVSVDLASSGTTTGGGVNDLLVVSGTLFPQSQTKVFINRISGPLPSNSTYTIANFGSFNASSGGTTNLILPVVRQGLTLIQNPTNLQIKLGAGAPASLFWRGDASSNNWDTNSSMNWRNTPTAGGANDVFFDWDTVTFDDNGSNTPNINISTTVSPDSLTVNSTKNYTFAGNGTLSGLAGIVKSGTGKLTIANTGINDFSGSITINGGTLEISDGNTSNVTLPTTAITDNAVLAFNKPDDATFTNAISGSGSVVKNGNGTLALAGASSYNGTTTINTGILKAGSATALGSAVGGTTVAANAVLDVGGQNLGAEVVTVQGGQGPNGNGVLINTGADQTQALQKVELLGAATLGGSTPAGGRLDIRGPTGVGGYFHGNKNDIFKVGTSTFSFIGLMETNIGSIDIQQGMLQFERSTLGDPSKSVTLENSGSLQLFGNFTNVTKPIVFNGGTLVSTSNSTETVINGPVTFTNNDGKILPSNVKMTINSGITGNGALQLLSSGTLTTLVLNGSNSYSGDTNLSGGTIIVNGVLANGNVNNNTGTANAIGGSGTFMHDVNGNSSTTFLPGGFVNVGTMTVAGSVNDNGGGTMVFDLGNTATVGGGVNDFMNVGQTLNLSGVQTIAINPIAGTLAGNSRYVLARASNIDANAGTNGSVSISFLGGALSDTRITSLAIDTATHPNEMDLVVTGSPANINWNGPGTSAVWDLHTTANFSGGPADNQFFNLDTVNFTGAGAGTATITGTLRPGAVNVNSATNYIFAGSGTLTGGMSLTKSGTGQLNVNNVNSYTGQTVINGGTVQIGATNALGTGGSIVIANTAGAVLNLATFSQSTTGLTGGGTTGGEVKVGGTGNFTVTVAYPNSNTYAGILSGTGTLTKAGFGSLSLTGSVPFNGAVSVTGGTLILGANYSGGTCSISDSSMLKMTAGPKLLGVTTLNLNTTGVLDLNDSAMIVDYTGASPLATIANQIKAGATDLSSFGPGEITSSAVVANAGAQHKTALGYADASSLGVTTFAGKSVDATAVLVRYTYLGDANVDGQVNALDFNAVATNFGGSGKVWSQGDFNTDGSVNTVDFTALAQNFGLVLAGLPHEPALGSLVPEPGTLSLFAIATAATLRRRRRAN